MFVILKMSSKRICMFPSPNFVPRPRSGPRSGDLLGGHLGGHLGFLTKSMDNYFRTGHQTVHYLYDLSLFKFVF